MQFDWSNRLMPEGATVITTLDTHAAGEPLRIITGGLPALPGATILAKRRYMQQNLDWVRRTLMWEPRGHYDMYGCVITPPVTAEADLGVLFMHNEGYSTMCGHGIIALVTALLETGAIEAKGRQTPVNIDTPAGLVRATAFIDAAGRVERVGFRNVASFVYADNVEVAVPGYGRVTLAIAFGGAFYAILPAASFNLNVEPAQTKALIVVGEAVKQAVNTAMTIRHPFEEDLSFLYGTILTDAPQDKRHHSRNICVFANAEVDRSPTGTGVSARLALHYARGEIKENEPIIIESILGAASVFGGRIIERTTVGQYAAIVPEVSGQAFITGRHEFIIDPRDALGKGFLPVAD